LFLLDIFNLVSYTCGMEEIWKDVKGYEGHYKVSNLGRIFSVEREIKIGTNIRKTGGKCMKTRVSKLGYERVTLNKFQVEKGYFIHRLVAVTFLGDYSNSLQVNHKDGNKLNNHLENLEWVSAKENIRHALQTGLINRKGRITKLNKLFDEDVRKIKILLEKKVIGKCIASLFKVSQQTISSIKHGRRRCNS